MSPGLWGAVAALAWGSADFAARFSGQALGYRTATFGMLLTGSALLTVWMWLTGLPSLPPFLGGWLLPIAGLSTLVGTLLLYNALARGPLTIVSPVVGGYPSPVVALAVIGGARPDATHWVAMAATLIGVLIVARTAGDFEDVTEHRSPRELRITVGIALGAALAFAVGLSAAQLMVPVYGALPVTWGSRLISVAGLALLFALRREKPRFTGRFAPLLMLQGALDTTGYVAVLAGSYGDGAAFAPVAASAFGAVTTLLARVFLRERIAGLQLGGITLIFVGVAVLSS
jgi:drug/metabolite transporter (DMT)-like permease